VKNSSSRQSAPICAPICAPILELIDVTLELGGEIILDGVNLSIHQDDTIVIIGPSGGGKSVLLKTMAGIYTPTTGKVLCYGHEWEALSMSEKHDVARKIGVQFQKSALFDELTAFENVAFPLREHTRDSDEVIGDRVLACLKAVGLEAAKSLLPHEMSGGMRQRLGIARAIALKPEILFLDDPTAGLDPVNSDLMAEMILNLKKEVAATLIIATHDMQMAYQFAGRILLVADKKVIETGNAVQTQNHPDPRVQQFIHGWLKGPLTEKY
jgi:phospholipid/cholesterol/gamma-HCH transport system ATP-binding protein